MSKATLQKNALMPTRYVRCITVIVPCNCCTKYTQQQPFGAYFGCLCSECASEVKIQYQIWCYENDQEQQTHFGLDSEGSFKDFAAQLNMQKIKKNVEQYSIPITSEKNLFED